MPIHHPPSIPDHRTVPPGRSGEHRPDGAAAVPAPARRPGAPRGAAGVLALGAVASLLLSACAAGDAGTPAEESAGPAGSSAAAAPGSSGATSATASASSGPASSTPASSTPASSTPASSSPAAAPGSASGRTHTSESGYFTWRVPAGWDVEQTELDDSQEDATGVPYETLRFRNGEETAEFRATTGLGPTDNDGPRPDLVAVLEVEPLPDVPVNRGGEGPTGEIWYRASLLRANEAVAGLPPYFDGGDEYVLAVQVVNVPAGVDPEPRDEADYWAAWTYFLPAVEGHQEGTANILAGEITQDEAEELTGERGEEAMRAVLDSPDYAQLRDLATSMEVRRP
ncbi:hypothetical protein E7744_05990 [Citricoccus sp. SGAir0253]|uniref:hypothetical protein n=1 Tax=Citricoccus sp. SGAir0253 TaxID=2567881 RepID=UPI0010CCC2B0|nr:hypothetical protein [Citricoccus sp. SGAir0253]QCU77792.1 hypothetical protein E7744_05990 [Citricoccus sp. SGAir0253]